MGAKWFILFAGTCLSLCAQATGELRGRVVDEDGKPVLGIRVEKTPGVVTLDDSPVTNANGAFTFRNLYPDLYLLLAKPQASVETRDRVRTARVAVFYPSATKAADAVQVPVGIGQSVSGIEIRLRRVQVHRVAGIVLDAKGRPDPYARVKLMGMPGSARRDLSFESTPPPIVKGADGSFGFQPVADLWRDTTTIAGPGPELNLAEIEVKADGTFEFEAVEPGDWRLTAIGDPGPFHKAPTSGVASVRVSQGDVEHVEILTSAPFLIPVDGDPASAKSPNVICFGGEIDEPGSFARTSRYCEVSPGPVRLSLVPIDGQPDAAVFDPETGGAEKIAHTWALPGRYRVLDSDSVDSDCYPEAVMWQGKKVKGQVVDLAPGAPPFRVVFRSGRGNVRGTVQNGQRASVFLVSRKSSGEIVTYRQVRCEPDGTFEINRVPPGEYSVIASELPDGFSLPAGNLPQVMLSAASTVRLKTGATARLSLRVNKWVR